MALRPPAPPWNDDDDDGIGTGGGEWRCAVAVAAASKARFVGDWVRTSRAGGACSGDQNAAEAADEEAVVEVVKAAAPTDGDSGR